jgi:hypothetical protein
VAGYRATSLVEGGYFAMTLHAPLASGPPVINGTPPPAVLGRPYDFTVSSTGTFSQVTAGTAPWRPLSYADSWLLGSFEFGGWLSGRGPRGSRRTGPPSQ